MPRRCSAGRLPGAAARGRRQSGGDLARGRVVLLGAARDAAFVAVLDRLAGSSSSRSGSTTGSRRRSSAGEITHTPALFVIDRQGRLSRLYMTQMSYTAVPPARSAAGAERLAHCCPASPRVRADSLPHADPADDARASLRRCRARGAGRSSSVRGSRRGCSCSSRAGIRRPSGLAGELDSLNRYQAIAARTGPAPVDGRRRGERRAEPEDADRLPATACRIRCPIRSLSTTGKLADGYEVLGAALVRADLADRSAPLLPGGVDRGVAEHQRPRPLHQGGARRVRTPKPAAGHRQSGARRLTATARVAAPAGRPAARKRVRARRPDPGAAGLSDRDQRVGLVVRAVPLGVRPASRRPPPATDGGSRSSAPIPTTRQAMPTRSWPSIPSATPATRRRPPACRSLAEIEGLPTTIFISPAGKVAYTCTSASTIRRERWMRTSAATRAKPSGASGRFSRLAQSALLPPAAFAVHELRSFLAYGGGGRRAAAHRSFVPALAGAVDHSVARARGRRLLRALGRAFAGQTSLPRYSASLLGMWFACSACLVAIFMSARSC